MSGVEVTGVSKRYGPATVLDRISASFEAGRFTSLLGPSGSGKTTLLRIVAGFVVPDEGELRIGAEEVTRVPVWKRRIGMVFQSYALFPHMTVLQNVMFGLNRRGVRGPSAAREAREALEMVRLSGFENRSPKQLSGGQQQRVALARAIVTKPTVLLLDEPLSALDRRLRQEMQVELKRIQRESGLTTIFVTHDQEEALTLSDRIAILDRGRIVQDGAPGEIYEQPRTRFAAGFLGDANFLEGTVKAGNAVEVQGGTVRVAGKLPAAGSKVTLAVRPEKMVILAPNTAHSFDNALPATLREVIYAGAVSTYLLAGPDGRELKVFSQNRSQDAAAPAPGAAVTLGWSAAHTIALED
ncbi:ABC transporter ATP-binding protein [Inquilinus limosus]|uniref:Spermidine/putrescine import ATP-binding protein PotA n=1 Tax=Inquilinus limosus MP06 TaxID=1398085 RepID=A0A0A0D4K3_9PROT|nr:ABC transporter ATP-binding protein [Inquilinus limosus]KGM32733.1 spermidine/putrescine ABC transporter ATP-binding protein [Inquilinus limosus MP06]